MKRQAEFEPPAHLTGRQRDTYDDIFRQPTDHNLGWHAVRTLLDTIAVVTEGDNGSLQVALNGHTLRLHAPRHKDAPAELLEEIRRFLEITGTPEADESDAGVADLLVVIDHREAKVYRADGAGGVPQSLVPFDPLGHGRHLHSANEWTDGKRQPERKSYYEAVARTLSGAARIVLFGTGTGRSCAMDQLLADLLAHHPEVAAKVVASVVLELHHATQPQLLAQARLVFSRIDSPIQVVPGDD